MSTHHTQGNHMPHNPNPAGRTKSPHKKTTLAMTVPEPIHEQVNKLAAETGRSVSHFCRNVLVAYLDDINQKQPRVYGPTEILETTGITYRQLNYWTTQGYVEPSSDCVKGGTVFFDEEGFRRIKFLQSLSTYESAIFEAGNVLRSAMADR